MGFVKDFFNETCLNDNISIVLKKILIAPNAFKHSLSSIEVAEIIASTLKSLDKKLIYKIAPIADGGDGTIDVIKHYFKDSKFIYCTVHDPLMRKIKSKWLLLDKNTAVIELSKASGLALLEENELNPLKTNTYGTGELIKHALDKGCKKIIITLGGSATVDGGLGILCALGVKLFDKNNVKLKPCGKALNQIVRLDLSNIDKRIYKTKIYVLCDVKNILIGPSGTKNFSKQKGASPKDQLLLERGMKSYLKLVRSYGEKDYSNLPMVGAAGGVAFSLKAILKGELFLGFQFLENLVKLNKMIKTSDVVITGEGRLDSQTFMGKGVCELIKSIRKINKKTKIIVLCGDYEKNINRKAKDIDFLIKIKPEKMSKDKAIKKAKKLLKATIKQIYVKKLNHWT